MIWKLIKIVQIFKKTMSYGLNSSKLQTSRIQEWSKPNKLQLQPLLASLKWLKMRKQLNLNLKILLFKINRPVIYKNQTPTKINNKRLSRILLIFWAKLSKTIISWMVAFKLCTIQLMCLWTAHLSQFHWSCSNNWVTATYQRSKLMVWSEKFFKCL